MTKIQKPSAEDSELIRRYFKGEVDIDALEEVTLRIVVRTLVAEATEKLETRVEQLERELGEAANEFATRAEAFKKSAPGVRSAYLNAADMINRILSR